MPDTDNIEIRSEEVQEIIGTPPARIIRTGITIIFSIIFMILIGSFFFKYPDIITARVTLTGDHPPAEIKARINGKIIKLFATDKQKVKKDQIIAVIENTCNYEDLKSLKTELDSIERSMYNSEKNLLNFKIGKNYQLGELQSYYSKFTGQINGYKDFTELDYHNKKIIAYKKQIRAYQNYLLNLNRQLKLAKKDMHLTIRQLKRDSALFQKEFLSVTDYEKSKSNVIQKSNTYESYINSISGTNITIAELGQNIIETELQRIDQLQEFEITITETYENLKAQIKIWEQNYFLKSPIDGTITFINYRNENQNVTTGEPVFTIVPKKTSELIAYAEIPLSGSGKVKKGQNVNIKFDDFPNTQFGMVKGKVETISLVQSNEFYIVKINLPDSLKTNYKKTLPFKQNMKGTAEILTDDLPLIARLFNPIKSLFYEKF